MSIAPPSDIILDVAQAADPQRLQAATAKLATMASSAGGPQPDFASMLASAAARAPVAKAPDAKPAAWSTLNPQSATVRPQMSPYRKFEAVLLQTFVQEILPKDASLFGDAASSDICRSMLAEQLANQLAKSGKIGIAKMIEKAHGAQVSAAAAAAGPAEKPAPPVAPPPGAMPPAAATAAAASTAAATAAAASTAAATAAAAVAPADDVEQG